jgi:hypothetical protein
MPRGNTPNLPINRLRGAGARQRLTQFLVSAGSGNRNKQFFESFDVRAFTDPGHEVGRNFWAKPDGRKIVNRLQ